LETPVLPPFGRLSQGFEVALRWLCGSFVVALGWL
jgi:hypothetical protein